MENGKDRRDVGIGRNQNFTAGREIVGLEGEDQRVEPGTDPDTVRNTAVGGELGFEALDVLAEHVPAARQRAIENIAERVEKGFVDFSQVLVINHCLIQ